MSSLAIEHEIIPSALPSHNGSCDIEKLFNEGYITLDDVLKTQTLLPDGVLLIPGLEIYTFETQPAVNCPVLESSKATEPAKAPKVESPIQQPVEMKLDEPEEILTAGHAAPAKETLSETARNLIYAGDYTREQLKEILYPGIPKDTAENRFSVLLSNLRQLLGKEGASIPNGSRWDAPKPLRIVYPNGNKNPQTIVTPPDEKQHEVDKAPVLEVPTDIPVADNRQDTDETRGIGQQETGSKTETSPVSERPEDNGLIIPDSQDAAKTPIALPQGETDISTVSSDNSALPPIQPTTAERVRIPSFANSYEVLIPGTQIHLTLRPNEFKVYEGMLDGLTENEIMRRSFAEFPYEIAKRLYDSAVNELGHAMAFTGWQVTAERIDKNDTIHSFSQMERRKKPTTPNPDETPETSRYTLTDKDIANITGYNYENHVLTSVDKELLIECVKNRSIVLPPGLSLERFHIANINSHLLRGTAQKLDSMYDLNTGKITVFMKDIPQSGTASKKPLDLRSIEPTDLIKLIDVRIKIAQQLPFTPRTQSAPEGLKISLQNLRGQETKGVVARSLSFTRFGELIDSSFRKTASPDAYRGMYSVSAVEQSSLIRKVFKTPEGTFSSLASAFNDKHTQSVSPRLEHEFGKIFTLTNNILNQWGLVLELKSKPVEGSSNPGAVESGYRLSKLTPDYHSPSFYPQTKTIEEEEEPLPFRQRRRRPSHAKSRL